MVFSSFAGLFLDTASVYEIFLGKPGIAWYADQTKFCECW